MDNVKKYLDIFKQLHDGKQEFQEQYKNNLEITMKPVKEKTGNKLPNLHYPLTWSAVITKTAGEFSSIYGQNEIFKAEPVTPNDVLPSKAITLLLNHRFWNIPDLYRKLYDIIMQKRIAGISPVLVTWTEKFNYKSSRAEDEHGILQRKRTKNLAYRGIDLIPINIDNFYWDTRIVSMEDADYVVIEKEITKDKCKELGEQGVYDKTKIDEAVANWKKDTPVDSNYSYIEENREEINTQLKKDTVNYNADIIDRTGKILHFYYRDRELEILNGKYIVRDEPNPYNHGKIPILIMTTNRIPFIFEGHGDPQITESQQHEINEIKNQNLAALKLINNPVLRVSKYSGLKQNDLSMYPGKIIKLDSNVEPDKAISPLNLGNIKPESFSITDQLEREFDRAQNVTAWQSGASQLPGAIKTATGQSLMGQAMNTRYSIDAYQNDYFFKQLGEMMLSLEMQYGDDVTHVRIVEENGYKFIPITQDDLAGNYDVKVNSFMKAWNKQDRFSTLAGLYNMLINNPQAVSMLNTPQWVRELVECADIGFADVYLKSPETMQQEAEAQAQAQEEATQKQFEMSMEADKIQKMNTAQSEILIAQAKGENQLQSKKLNVEGKIKEIETITEADVAKTMANITADKEKQYFQHEHEAKKTAAKNETDLLKAVIGANKTKPSNI